MKKLWKILRFALPYKGHALLNILFNVFGVFFYLASFAFFIPVLNILFKQTPRITEVPAPINWDHILNKDVLSNNLNYFLSQNIDKYGEQKALMFICIIIVVLYFLKNFFRYMAMFFLA